MKPIKNTPVDSGGLRALQRAARARKGQGGYVLLMVFIFLLILGMVVGYLMVGTLTTEKEVGVSSDQDLAMQNARLALRDAQLDILGRLNNNAYAMNQDGTRLQQNNTTARLRRPDFTRPSFCTPNFWTQWGAPYHLYDFKAGDQEGKCTPRAGSASGGGSGASASTLSGPACGRPAGEACTVKDVILHRLGEMNGVYVAGVGVLQRCQGKEPWKLADWGPDFGRAGPGCGNNQLVSVQYGDYTGARFDTSNGVPAPRYIIEIITPDQTGLDSVDAKSQGDNVTRDKVLFRITAVGYGASVAVTNQNRRMHVMVQEVVAP